MAKGSHAGFFGLAPEKRYCKQCGEKVVLSHKRALNFDMDGCWHFDCWLEASRTARASLRNRKAPHPA